MLIMETTMIRNNDFSLEYINNLPCLLAHGQCAADRKKSTFLNETGVFIFYNIDL